MAENCLYGYNSFYTIIDARRGEVYLAKMALNDKKYFEIEEHSIVEKINLAGKITENSTLIYRCNTVLDDSITGAILNKQVNIINSARYSAAITAKIGWQKYQYSGGDDLSELEPLYIRPFAGV